FANAEGNSSTSFPFDSNSDHTWQWHYDSSEFNNPFPVSIVDISVRANNNASISAFDFGSVSIDLIEASTDYLTVSHDTTFANNVLRSKRTRAASPWSGPGLASSLSGPADFLPLESTRSFFYDPNTNNDFIVELRSCGVVSNWGASVDGQSGGVGVVGGNRYGHTSDCTATAQNTTNNEFVPITKISYVPANVSSFPYVQTFDHLDLQNADEQPLGWEQSDTDGSQDWFFINVPTSSTNTGPPADHTTGVPGQGGYAYTEHSDGSEPAVDLLTPVFDFSGVANPRMSFWMHSRDGSNGSTPNHLRVSAILYPSGTIVGPLTPAITPFGDDEWHQVTVNLGSLAGQRAQVVFRGTTDGGSFTNDIAIDDLVVVDFQGGPGQNPQAGLATLDVNAAIEANGLSVSSGAPGPYVAQARLAETMIFDFGGAPNQPILLLAGPLNPGITTFPGIGQLDIGANPVVGGVPSSLFVVADGNLVTPPDLFFRTDLFGGARFVYPTPNLPPGSFLNLQAILFTGGPSVIAMSNAVRIIITP
ncbi:MAG: choice-of-anchor J domain-containing protein, partial [Planctomycetes bacterium]|nr:choice-of-anchor J domain-containing protein [Planctomycetota bacterium]